jgi:molybdopterin-synthase adenylyltransferase
MSLSEAEVARYARQLVLPSLDEGAQERVNVSRVHVVGAGPSGGPAMLYLAQAGVGTIYVDDGGDVVEGDEAAWLYAPDDIGEPRLMAAMAAVSRATAFAKARPYATTGAMPTAVLVCGPTRGIARVAADRARLAGLPHVVAVAQGSGGEIVSVPSGAPCYSCGSRPGAGAMAQPAIQAAVGVLGALELILMLAGVGAQAGRRIELVAGQPHAQATTRIPGCDCRNVY